MTLGADLITAVQGDYQYVDGVETVTYTVRATGAVLATVHGIPAAEEMSEQGEMAVSKATRQAWILWANTMGSVVPAAGDTITDAAGVVWTVNESSGPAIGASRVYYRCECVKQR